MSSFKSNLLVTINLIIFLNLNDTYASDPDKKKKITCEEWLDAGGYNSVDNALENYLSMYKKFAKHKKYEEFEDNSDSSYSDKCEGFKQLLISKGVTDAYVCDVIRILRKLSSIHQWCTISQGVLNAAIEQKIEEITKCKDTIKKSGFIFLRSINNYAHYLTEYKEKNLPLDEPLASEYIKHIEEEVTLLSSTVLYGTGLWCCLQETSKDGYKETDSGSRIFQLIQKSFGFSCDKHTSNIEGRGYKYCKYVEESTKGKNNVDGDNEILDSAKWCRHYQKTHNTKPEPDEDDVENIAE